MSDAIEPGGVELDGVEIDGLGSASGLLLQPTFFAAASFNYVLFLPGTAGVSDVFYVPAPPEVFLVSRPPEAFNIAPGRNH